MVGGDGHCGVRAPLGGGLISVMGLRPILKMPIFFASFARVNRVTSKLPVKLVRSSRGGPPLDRPPASSTPAQPSTTPH